MRWFHLLSTSSPEAFEDAISTAKQHEIAQEHNFLRLRVKKVLGNEWEPEEILGPVVVYPKFSSSPYHVCVARIGQHHFSLGDMALWYVKKNENDDTWNAIGTCYSLTDVAELENM